MSYKSEFEVIDMILASDFKTQGVDSFSLCVLKMERQMRRVFTYTIFQYYEFHSNDILELIDVLSSKRNLYFNNFIVGFDAIYVKSIEEIYGSDYGAMFKKFQQLRSVRNKIFHGQLTGDHLSRDDLKMWVSDIRFWCFHLADSLSKEIGYDGFSRNAYRKSVDSCVFQSVKWPFHDTRGYSKFLDEIGR